MKNDLILDNLKIKKTTRLTLHKLYYVPYSKSSEYLNISGTVEKEPLEAYAVIRKSTDDTILINKDGLDMIELFMSGKSVLFIANKLDYPINQIEIFAKHLIRNGFVKMVDENKIPDHKHKVHPWFVKFTKRYFKIFISKTFLYFVWIFISTGLIIALFDKSLWPRYEQFFWHPDPLVVVVSLVLIGNLALVIHEIGHFIITKALGGEAKISFDHRYLFLVAQTTSYYVNFLPVPQRLLLYLAGLIVDLITISGVYWVLFICRIFDIQLPFESILLAFVLIQIQGVLWQFNMHLETDLYNTFSDFIEFDNLRATTKYQWIVKIIRLRIPIISRLFFKHYVHLVTEQEHLSKEKLSHLTKYKKKLWYFYNIMLVIGIIFTTFEFLYLVLPRELQFLKISFGLIKDFGQNDLTISLFKGILIFVLVFYKYFILIWTVHRKRIVHRSYGFNPFESL